MTPVAMTLRSSRATRRAARTISERAIPAGPASLAVTLLVLETCPAPADVVPADLLAGRGVARPGLLRRAKARPEARPGCRATGEHAGGAPGALPRPPAPRATLQ